MSNHFLHSTFFEVINWCEYVQAEQKISSLLANPMFEMHLTSIPNALHLEHFTLLARASVNKLTSTIMFSFVSLLYLAYLLSISPSFFCEALSFCTSKLGLGLDSFGELLDVEAMAEIGLLFSSLTNVFTTVLFFDTPTFRLFLK